jgi:hypothetical protein
MSATAIPAEIVPEQIDVPDPDTVAVAAADLSRRYGSFPVGSILAFTVTAIVAGILAAVAPARRASRLDVLSALQYE